MKVISVDTLVCPCECGGHHTPVEVVDTKLGINIRAGAVVHHITSDKVWCRCNKCHNSGGFFTVPKGAEVVEVDDEEIFA